MAIIRHIQPKVKKGKLSIVVVHVTNLVLPTWVYSFTIVTSDEAATLHRRYGYATKLRRMT